MFTAGRYIVIDDNRDELRSLVDALHELGAPAIGIHYDALKGVPPNSLIGARVLFIDLHLIDGVQIGNQTKAFDVIVQLLDDGIASSNGPYIVVLWTSHAEQREAFEAHLMGRLPAEKRPIAVLDLDKNRYLKGGQTADGPQLKADVTAAVSSDPRLHAMLKWEHDVLNAASATLAALCSLIPEEDRTPDRYGNHLDRLLSVLACAAAGKSHAKDKTQAAVGEALLPLLNDRLRNQQPTEGDALIWQNAATKIDAGAALAAADAARLNTMLHLAVPPVEASGATDWGAVLRIPDAALTDERMKARFGMTLSELRLSSATVHRKQDRRRCIPVLVRIGAACDYAQNKAGPIPYLFGTLVPLDARPLDPGKWSPALMASPVFALPQLGEVKLCVDARYQISLTRDDVEGWSSICRVREQLLLQIASHCASYVARPGIVSIAIEAEESPLEQERQTDPDLATAPLKAAAAQPENPAE